MIRLCLCIATASLCASCGVVPPRVSYQIYTVSQQGNDEFGYPFRHRRSLLRIKQENGIFKVETAPSELDIDGHFTPMYMIRGADDLRAVTQVKITYLDNTKLPDKIDITTSDNIADTINKVGEVVSAAVPLLAGSVSAPEVEAVQTFKETVLDPGEMTQGKWIPDAMNAGYCLMMSALSVEEGISVADYVESRRGRKVIDFPVPSCATAIIHIAQCNDQQTAARMRVIFAAYDKVTPMSLPSSGSLKMSSICGASVTEADKQDRSDLTTYLQSLMTSVNNIKAAAKKK